MFHEFIDSLVDFGEEELAEGYLLEVFMPLLFEGYTPEEALDMNMDDVIRYIRTPPGIPGWNTVWGKHIVYGDDNPN